MFAADLCRCAPPVTIPSMRCADPCSSHIHVPGMQIDCVRASSYGHGTSSSGEVTISGMTSDVSGRSVLLIEDIVDTGLTLEKLRAYMLGLGATSCEIVTLLDKVERRKNSLVPEYVGFICPDEFVVGFGLDYGGLVSYSSEQLDC